MNKYELTVVVNAMTEDDVRTAVIEKVKELVAKCGGTITAVDEAGKKKLAYEIQKMNEAKDVNQLMTCLLYTSPSPRDRG